MIITVHHAQITVPKGAEAAARDFYCGLLGLNEIAKPQSLLGRGGFWLEAGTFPVHIGVEDGVDRSRSKAHVAYLVDDLETLRAELSANNIEILDVVPIPGFSRFEIRDPFGNRVEFLEKRTMERR